MRLRIDMENWRGRTRFVEYDNFHVKSELENFKLAELGQVTGTAGSSIAATSQTRKPCCRKKTTDNEMTRT